MISIKEVQIVLKKVFSTSIEEELIDKFREKTKANNHKLNEVLEAFMQEYCEGDFTLEKKTVITLRKENK